MMGLVVVLAALAVPMAVTVVAMPVSMLLRQGQRFHPGDAEVILLRVNGQSWR